MEDNETCSKYVMYQFHDTFMDESLFRANVKMNMLRCDCSNTVSNLVSIFSISPILNHIQIKVESK